MNNLSKYSYIRIDLSWRKTFISAWESAFDRRLSTDIYDWIFNEYNLMYAAVCDDKVAAGLCLYPMDAIVNSNFSRVGLANNGFVAPPYRGQNLFVTVSQFALRNAGKHGFSLAYGISNEQALPGHKKVGWSVLPTLQFLESQRVEYISSNNVQWYEAPLSDNQRADIESCSRRSALHRQFSIIKTSELIRWRYELRPQVNYIFGFNYQDNLLQAYCVCKYFPEKKYLHFIDIDGDSASAIMLLIEAAQSLDLPFESLNIWSSTVHSKLFFEQGYHTTLAGRNFILIQPSELKSVDVIGEINLVLGDNDVF